MRSLRQALQPFRRDTGFAIIAVLTLALGIGVATAIFTVVNSVLLEQLSYEDPEQLVFVDHQALPLELPSMGISRKLYAHYAENNQALQGIGLYDQFQATLTEDGPPERVGASNVSPSYFRVLGIEAQLGRLYVESDGSPEAARLAVLSDELWRSRYGADRGVLGRAIQINGEPHEVIGVLPAGADAPNAARNSTVVYRNRRLDPNDLQLGAFSDIAVARLRPGRDLEGARVDFQRMLSNLSETFPEDQAAAVLERAELAARIDPLLDRIVGPVRATLWVLLATVGVILLIACTNVANLFLVRVEERSHEIAIRGALGAGRRRLVGELLSESLTLAVVGGALGFVLAIFATDLVRRYGPSSLPRLEEIAINGRVALVALGLSLFSGLLFGLLPALRGTAQKLLARVNDGVRSTSGRERHLLRSLLVTAQVAMGLLLLVSSGLVVRTLMEIRQVDPGFDPKHAVSFRVSLPEIEYPEAAQRVAFIEESLERIAALPGVRSATVASGLPLLSGNTNGSGYLVEDQPIGPDQLPHVFMQSWVAPGHLRAMGIELLEGRDLEPVDHHQRTGNVLVSEGIARRFWPDGSALGKRIATSRAEEGHWYTIVGVVTDVHDFGLRTDPPLRVYRPLLGLEDDGGDIGSGLSFVIRASVPPRSTLPQARSEIWAIDSNLPISTVRTLDELIEASHAQMSFTLVILVLSAALALALAAIGLYGVISYIVTRRSHEIGVRVALGAQRSDVTRMILRGGLVVSGLGTLVGLGLAVGLTRLLDSILFGVGALDPVTFLVVPVLLMAVSLLACYLPARRAARVAPVVALRSDG